MVHSEGSVAEHSKERSVGGFGGLFTAAKKAAPAKARAALHGKATNYQPKLHGFNPCPVALLLLAGAPALTANDARARCPVAAVPPRHNHWLKSRGRHHRSFEHHVYSSNRLARTRPTRTPAAANALVTRRGRLCALTCF